MYGQIIKDYIINMYKFLWQKSIEHINYKNYEILYLIETTAFLFW